MIYVFVFGIGVLFGYLIAAIMSSSGYTDRMQEAYDAGYKMGLKNSIKNK